MRRWLGIMVGTGRQNFRGTKSRPMSVLPEMSPIVFPMLYKPFSLVNLEPPSVQGH